MTWSRSSKQFLLLTPFIRALFVRIAWRPEGANCEEGEAHINNSDKTNRIYYAQITGS
jgi:hypothetical protein